MSDAAEVLEAIYGSLGAVPGGGALVAGVFGLRVREVLHCGACGRDTHCNTYTQFFYNMSATALRMQHCSNQADGRAPPLGRLLWVRARLPLALHSACSVRQCRKSADGIQNCHNIAGSQCCKASPLPVMIGLGERL